METGQELKFPFEESVGLGTVWAYENKPFSMPDLYTANNDNSAEIRIRILMANKGFYGLKRQFRSQFLSIKNKMKYYKTLIRPLLANGSETWVL